MNTPALTPAQIRKQRILQDRARELAGQRDEKNRADEQIEFLEFQAGSGRFGIQTIHAQEVGVLKDYTILPGTPPFILGIMNLRGRILAILDLKTLFDLPSAGLTYHNKAIVIRNEKSSLALMGDEIIGVRTLPLKCLQSVLPNMTGFRSEFATGLAPDGTVILDANGILDDPRIVVDFETERSIN